MSEIVQQLEQIDRKSSARSLSLRTPRAGPIDVGQVLKYHVQGITRSDGADRATLAVSLSSRRRGALWLAEFALEGDPRGPHGSRRLAARGEVVHAIATGLAHPGGLQASGNLLAVALEDAHGWARVEIYDIAAVRAAKLVDTLVLNNSLREGVSQLTRSKASFVAFTQRAPGEYLLFVGGRGFALEEGWFYRYFPARPERFRFEGSFAGAPRSSVSDAWGPQSSAAFVRAAPLAEPRLITFGCQGTRGAAAFQSRVRCFSLEQGAGGPMRLVHEPCAAPATFTFKRAELSRLCGPNARWGSTAFVAADGALLTYFTARNPRPDREETHVLTIAEVRTVA